MCGLLVLGLHYVTTAWAKSGAVTWNALSGRHNDLTAEDTRTRQTGRRARQTEADSRDSRKHTLFQLCEDPGEICESPESPPRSKACEHSGVIKRTQSQ